MRRRRSKSGGRLTLATAGGATSPARRTLQAPTLGLEWTAATRWGALLCVIAGHPRVLAIEGTTAAHTDGDYS